MDSVIRFIQNEIVLCVAFVLALISSFIVHPDAQYISYIDYRTLGILLALMLTMAGFQTLGVFRQIGEMLVGRMKTIVGVSFVLVFLSFFSSMFITNDVALITFVPFTIVTLTIAGRKDLFIPVIVLETIAANLGSMATPIGNPQNLYLYSLADMSLFEFIRLMFPYTLVAGILLIACLCLRVRGEAVAQATNESYKRSSKDVQRIIAYCVTFLISILVVARVLDFRIGVGVVIALVLIADYRTLRKADYSLLLTFVFLFIFIGNMKRMPVLSYEINALLSKEEVLVSILLSQIISNVPTAILCSGFTDNISRLIVGTNLGGLGTLIASMASLISFKQYSYIDGADKKKYLISFTAYNIGFLMVMLILYFVIR